MCHQPAQCRSPSDQVCHQPAQCRSPSDQVCHQPAQCRSPPDQVCHQPAQCRSPSDQVCPSQPSAVLRLKCATGQASAAQRKKPPTCSDIRLIQFRLHPFPFIRAELGEALGHPKARRSRSARVSGTRRVAAVPMTVGLLPFAPRPATVTALSSAQVSDPAVHHDRRSPLLRPPIPRAPSALRPGNPPRVCHLPSACPFPSDTAPSIV